MASGNIVRCRRVAIACADGRHREAFARDSQARKKVSSHCLSLLVDGGGSHKISVEELATYFPKADRYLLVNFITVSGNL